VRRVQSGLIALGAVLLVGTVGYVLFGFDLLDAVYQTVTTVTTVGFREVKPFSAGEQIFTIVLILVGVGTALYTLSVLLEAFVEGHFLRHLEARRMERTIARLRDHVIICGWGRVGRASAAHLAAAGQSVVVVDRDPARLEDVPHPYVLGDIGTDDVLVAAGIQRARALVAALADDADNVYATLSARALRPDLVIIARARSEGSMPKLYRAGADEVVNPQLIGGLRMASFALTHPTRDAAPEN
jgi:voltage-gated potassium channel